MVVVLLGLQALRAPGVPALFPHRRGWVTLRRLLSDAVFLPATSLL